MRILSFEKYWPKLHDSLFTTFRFPRADRDWEQGELVQIVVRSRSAERLPLGVAKISLKSTFRVFPGDAQYVPFLGNNITAAEAIKDGFPDLRAMYDHFVGKYGKRLLEKPLNKLVLMWTEHW